MLSGRLIPTQSHMQMVAEQGVHQVLLRALIMDLPLRHLQILTQELATHLPDGAMVQVHMLLAQLILHQELFQEM